MSLSPRTWAVWRLPLPLRLLVVAVVGSYAILVAVGVATIPFSTRQWTTATVFAACAVVSVEVSMRLAWPRTRRDRMTRDLLGVWLVPVALVLPPPFVAAIVLAPCLYIQLRVWRGEPIKVAYSAASLGLAYAAASATYLGLAGGSASSVEDLIGSPRAAMAVFAAVGTWWVVNHALIGTVVAMTAAPEAIAAFLRDREGFVLDLADVSLGVIAAILWLARPAAVVLLLPPVLLLQHELFSGLRRAVRTDQLTDVASPQFWREVAGREVERARASGAHLAVLMIDVDHFKSVNDRHGHLAGDEVLAAVARTITKALRPGDLVGRLGGEEFGALLTGLNLLDAEGAAERVRSQAAGVRVRSDHGEWVGVTVSVGVAELTVSGSSLHDLLSAADRAMYAAKAAGRNKVRAAGPRRGQTIDLSAAERGSSLDLDVDTAQSTS